MFTRTFKTIIYYTFIISYQYRDCRYTIKGPVKLKYHKRSTQKSSVKQNITNVYITRTPKLKWLHPAAPVTHRKNTPSPLTAMQHRMSQWERGDANWLASTQFRVADDCKNASPFAARLHTTKATHQQSQKSEIEGQLTTQSA